MPPFIDALKARVRLYFQGMIVLWSGAVIDIPDGWQLCDGTNGTPDLQDKFVPGAGGAYAPEDAGGEENHRHLFTSDGHDHNIGADVWIAAGADWTASTASETVIGATDYTAHHPPYYALCYIMKL